MKHIPRIFWILGGLVAIPVLFLLVATVLGSLMPEEHTASASRVYDVPPARVWSDITDFEGAPGWRKQVASSVKLPETGPGGEPIWRETYRQGGMALNLSVTEQEAETLLVRQITNEEEASFTGGWRYELEPLDDGTRTRLTITENGGIPNPTMRWIYVTFIGLDTALTHYLDELAAKYAGN